MNKPWKTRKDDHDFMKPDRVELFLRNHKTGTDNLGRVVLGQLVKEYDSVLDAAAGTAVNYEVFRNMGLLIKYTGLDRTKQFIEHANRRYGSQEGFQIVEGYVEEMPFEDKTFDAVILRHIVEHLAEGYELAIKEALRVATKEVILVFFLHPHNGPEDIIEKRPSDVPGHPDVYHYWNTYSWEKLCNFLAGLNVIIRKVGPVVTPGAAHSDLILRLIK